MMKARVLSALAILSLLVVSYSALPLIASDAEAQIGVISAGARCCTYGADCASDLCCLAPNANEADCSQNKKNYCRKCAIAIEEEPISPVAELTP